MSDRDELLEILALYMMHETDAGNAADALFDAGWRRPTVTPEQVERALRKLDNFDGVLRSLADDVARARAELGNVIAGLSVTEERP